MEFTLAQVAEVLNGTVDGDATAKVHNLSKIEEGKPGMLCFLANPKYTHYIYETEATAVIVDHKFVPEKALKTNLIRVEDAYSSFAQLLDFYSSFQNQKVGVSPKSDISDSAQIGKEVYIGAFVSIGDHAVIGDGAKIYANSVIGDRAKVGENSKIYANVSLYHDCIIGANAIVHAGAVIGSDGFGFAPQEDGTFKKIAQVGNVVIGDNVEIGANTTIDRATMGSTIIHDGVKLDNLVQIAHNVEVGANTGIASQSGISGSTKVGENCILAGQVGLVGHIKIGDGVTIAAQSGVTSSVKSDSTVLGSPAIDFRKQRKNLVHSRNLYSIVERLVAVEEKLKEK